LVGAGVNRCDGDSAHRLIVLVGDQHSVESLRAVAAAPARYSATLQIKVYHTFYAGNRPRLSIFLTHLCYFCVSLSLRHQSSETNPRL
jgi:hypothetical protein